MKTQTLDLNKMGLTSMSEMEMMEVEGGIPVWVWPVFYFINSNWEEIKSGLVDGWKAGGGGMCLHLK